MKKVVRHVVSYDDVYLAEEGREVEADVEVRVTIGDEEVLLMDLASEHEHELRQDLARWLGRARVKPVRKREYRSRRTEGPGLPVCRNPAPPGLTNFEVREYLTHLREWATAQGRSEEIHRSEEGKYTYGQQIADDYRNFLAVQAAERTGHIRPAV